MKQHVQVGTLLALIIGGALLIFFALKKLAVLVILILIATVLTTGIDPLVRRLQTLFGQRHPMPRALATLLVLLIGLVILFSAVAFLATTAIQQAIHFSHNTQLQATLARWLTDLSKRYAFIPDSPHLLAMLRAQSDRLSSYLWSTTMALFSIIGGVFSAVMVFILTFFFTTFQDGITHNLMQLVPTAYQARTREVAHHAAQKMGGWLRGQITLALIITTLITAGMMFPAPHYAILLGIIAGVGELIPMVGPYLAFLPAILIVLLLGGHSGHIVYVAVFFILITMTENYILAPKIMQKNVGLHPVSTVLAMFTGGSLLGIVGALLAIPLTAAGRVIMLEAIFPAIHGITTEATPAIPATKKHKTGHGKAAVQPTETT